MNTSPYTRRILKWIDRATDDQVAEGSRWYREAGKVAREIADESPYTFEQVAGVIAVLSPQTTWAHNMSAAKQAVRFHSIGRRQLVGYAGYGTNAAKAMQVLDGDFDVIRGPKVTAFWRNIMGDLSPVTVDVWATRAARSDIENMAKVFRSGEMPGARERRIIEQAYRQAAKLRGLEPSEAQAIAWVVCRESGRWVKPPHDEAGARRWYLKQLAARESLGLTTSLGDYAWGGAPRGQTIAREYADQYEAEGIF